MTCNAHPLGQPLIIFAQILALQNLANVSRSNYIYLELGHQSPPSPCSLTLALLILSQSSEFISPLFISLSIRGMHNADEEV